MEMFLGDLLKNDRPSAEKFLFDADDLLTHIFICGSTGSGKTVLGKLLIEEAALLGIPSVMVDLKGDMSSLAIPILDINYEEIEPWVDVKAESERPRVVEETIKLYRSGLRRAGKSTPDFKAFRDRVDVKIFTPRSRLAEQFSISLFYSPQKNAPGLVEEDVLLMFNQSSREILRRLYGEEQASRMHEERALIEEVVNFLWNRGVSLTGRAGIIEIIKAILRPPFERIGVFKVDDFISLEKRQELARRMNTLLVGLDGLWYEGKTIEEILAELSGRKPTDRVPILIFNLSMLNDFEEKNLVLSQIAYAIYGWMKRKIESFGPRLIFYLDEIGAGKASFFPEDPHQNASKSAIGLLIRQGRAFGVCCILSTQNPGDIDYKGLTNAQTWFIGKLQTHEDRQKLLQGISASDFFLKQYESFIKNVDTGDFMAKLKDGKVLTFRERWLLSFHKVLTADEFPKLKYVMEKKEVIRRGLALLRENKGDEALRYFDERIKEFPNDAGLRSGKADVLARLGRSEEAILEYSKIIELRPHDFEAWLAKGELERIVGRPANAVETLKKGLELNPVDDRALFQLGLAYRALGQHREAEESLYASVKQNPSRHEAWYWRGESLLELGELDSALDSFKRAVQIGEERFEYLLALGRTCLAMGTFLSAIEYLDRAIEIAPERELPYIYKARIFSRQREFQRAAEVLTQGIRQAENVASLWIELARVYGELGEDVKAIETFRKALSIERDNLDALIGLTLHLVKLNRLGEAEAALRKAEALGGDEAALALPRSRLLGAKGDCAAAISTLQKGLQACPDSFELNMELGRLLAAEGMTKEAIVAFETAVSSNPSSREALLALAAAAEMTGENQKAIETYEKLLYLYPREPDVLNLFGKLLNRLGKYARAREIFVKMLEVSGTDPRGWIGKSAALAGSRFYDEALEALDHAEKFSPDNPEIWAQRGEIYAAMRDHEKAEFCRTKVAELSGGKNK